MTCQTDLCSKYTCTLVELSFNPVELSFNSKSFDRSKCNILHEIVKEIVYGREKIKIRVAILIVILHRFICNNRSSSCQFDFSWYISELDNWEISETQVRRA